MVSLPDYVGRMKDGQDKIYYITADGFVTARNSPHLEIFRKKSIEVLLLHDRVDEWVVANLREFEGRALQSVAEGNLDLGTLADAAEAEAMRNQEGDYQALLERMRQALAPKASDVRLTNRLSDSPACLVSDQHGMSRNLERLLKAGGQTVPFIPPVLEINPHHPIVERLKSEASEERFADWSHILFDQALLAEGGQLDDPAGFVKRLNELMIAMTGGGRSRIWTPNG